MPVHQLLSSERNIARLVVVVAVALALPLQAATEPSSSRGFSPDQVYHVTGIDSVNDFTGNLNVAIPIGPTFKSNGSLTYGFVLTYNSNLWDYRVHGSAPRDDPKPHWDSGGDPTDAFPTFDFNAGVGWRVSIGGHPKRHPIGDDLDMFVDASGAEHSIRGSALDNSPPGTAAFTNDSSYLRYHSTGSIRTFEYPDGIQERFICIADCAAATAWWDLDQRSDPYGDVLWVTRGGEPTQNGQTWIWTYYEGVGNGPYPDHQGVTAFRTHTVEYTRDDQMTGKYKITKITLASAGPNSQAVYNFNYEDVGVMRPFTHSARSTPTVPYGPRYPGNRMPVTLLTSVTVPVSNEGTDSGDWFFDYIIDPSETDYPGDAHLVVPPDGSPSFMASHYSGLLEKVTLPTRGAIRYKYTTRRLSKLFCEANEPDERQRSFTTTAVRERAILDRQGNQEGRPWRYISGHFRPGTGCSFAREQITGTLDPFGKLEVTYHSLFIDGTNPNNFWTKYEWGLPVSKEEQDASGRFLQSHVFQCSDPTIFDGDGAIDALRRLHARYLLAGETLSCGDPLRTNYVQWESDSHYCRNGDDADCDQTNRRILSSATVYHDDGDTFTEVVNDDYDGLGHYRTTKTGGNFWQSNYPNITGGDERVTFTNYNPGVVFFNHGFVTLPNNASLSTLPWVLSTFDLKKVKQARNGQAGGANPQISSTLYRFNATTGFLERQRRLRKSVDCVWIPSTARADCYDAGSLDSHDLLTDNVRTQNGNAASILTSHYGGDNASLSTSGDLSTPIGESADYVIRRDYRYGELESSGYYDCGANAPILLVEQNVIDPNSGLVVSSKDSAGAETTYAYDNLGRYSSVDPPGADAPTGFTYTAATQVQPASVEAKTVGAGGVVLKLSTWAYDHLGRVAEVHNRVPGANGLIASSQFFTYRVDGPKLTESTVGPTQPAGTTIWSDFDPFGRAKTVVHPDQTGNKTRKTTYLYIGIRTVVETQHGLATSANANGAAQTSRSYDRFGNVSKFSETSGANNADTRTRYEYDNLDNLVLVDGANGQSRFYNYDQRGFLFAETVPELAGRTVHHLGYDARGNAHQIAFAGANAPATPFDLTMEYDGAERFLGVTQTSTSHLLKAFTYFPQNDSTNPPLSGGRLRRSVRANWVPSVNRPTGALANVQATNDYTYDPDTGRVASKKTSVSGLTFTSNFTWDPLGNLKTFTYPRARQCPSCTLLGPSRTVTFNYSEGELTSVPSYASAITYNANGTVNTVRHGNGAVDTFDVDPNYMIRPAAIKTTFPASATWTTGAYKYDVAGNVFGIGTDAYVYDKVSRLVKATLSNGSQEFAYDAAGNLKNLPGTAATSNSMPLDPATNRLASTNAVYDLAGNLTQWTDPRDSSVAVRDYDPFNLVTHNHGAGQGKIYLYDDLDQRVGLLDYGINASSVRETWSARGVNNEVVRDFTRTRTTVAGDTGNWNWRDYVYRGKALLAEVVPNGAGEELQHVHLDHLGSVRRISNSAGAVIDDQEFYPFGLEVNDRPDDNRFKFSGHERDGGTNPLGYLDYMGARYYAPSLARFTSLDSVTNVKSNTLEPQRWNRYSYAANNPIKYIDPDGREIQKGIKAGVIVNQTEHTTIWIAGNVPGPNGTEPTVVIPLFPGESSSRFMQDADALIIAPGQEINGETAGAFKNGPTTIVVSDSSTGDGSLVAGGPLYSPFAAGKWAGQPVDNVGYMTPDQAQKEGWTAPAPGQATGYAEQRQTLEIMEDLREAVQVQEFLDLLARMILEFPVLDPNINGIKR